MKNAQGERACLMLASTLCDRAHERAGRACSKSAMAAMAVASEAIDCSMRAWLVLPIAFPSAAAAALAACAQRLNSCQ